MHAMHAMHAVRCGARMHLVIGRRVILLPLRLGWLGPIDAMLQRVVRLTCCVALAVCQVRPDLETDQGE